MKDSRLVEFDIAKGIAIICVILGHLGNNTIDRFVYVFHMPLFFIISGYFLSLKTDISSYIRKKMDGLIVPYLISSLSILVAFLFFYCIWGYQARRSFLEWVLAIIYGSGAPMSEPLDSVGHIGAIWFLLALFWSLCLLRYLCTKNYAFLISVVLAYVGYSTSKTIWAPFSIQAGLVGVFFAYIGYWSRKNNILSIQIHPIVITGLVMLVIWEIVYYKGLYLSYCFFGNGIIDIIASLCACYLIMKVCICFSKNHMTSKILSFYGRNSIIVLALHITEQSIFPWNMMVNSYLPFFSGKMQLLLIFLFKVVWATLGVIVINKIDILDRLFKGKAFVFVKKQEF